MKKLITPAALTPMIAGVAIGALLFAFGYSQDAPGMCLIGLSIAFVLVMWGIYRAGLIKKGFLSPIFLFCFGAGGIVLSIMLLLDGELEDSPGLALVGVAIGIVLIVLGAVRLRKARAVESRQR